MNKVRYPSLGLQDYPSLGLQEVGLEGPMNRSKGLGLKMQCLEPIPRDF